MSKEVLLEPENVEYIPKEGDYLQEEPPIDYEKHQLKIYYRMGESHF